MTPSAISGQPAWPESATMLGRHRHNEEAKCLETRTVHPKCIGSERGGGGERGAEEA